MRRHCCLNLRGLEGQNKELNYRHSAQVFGTMSIVNSSTYIMASMMSSKPNLKTMTVSKLVFSMEGAFNLVTLFT